MARMTSMEALEKKIEKAQEQVSKTKKQYESAVSTLSELLDKRDSMRRDEILKAYVNSNRTYEETLAFFEAGSEDGEK